MAIIRVTRGGCGVDYKDGNGVTRHALKTPENGPFECDDAQAERLVNLGVAAYASEPQPERPAVNNQPPENPAAGEQVPPDENVSGHLDAAQLETMTNKQLEELGAEIGADITGCKKKADYIAAIMAVQVEAAPEDDEAPPAPGVADPE